MPSSDPKALADETCERAMMKLEAEADALMAQTPEFGVAIRSLANLAPPPFRERAAAQIDALVRQAMCDAFYRGFNAHKDHAALRSAHDPEGMGETQGITVAVTFLPRPDGGLRVCSPTLPGLILSAPDQTKVLEDVGPAIHALLEHDGKWPQPPVLKREETGRGS